MLFAMGDDLSYGLNTLGPLCLWQCLQNSRSSISCFRIPLFLVIRFIFQFTSKIPTTLLWPSASATWTVSTNSQELLYIGIINSIELVSSSARVTAKFQKGVRVTGIETPGPIDRTPETPGSGKNWKWALPPFENFPKKSSIICILSVVQDWQYSYSIKTREVLGDPSPMPKRFLETQGSSRISRSAGVDLPIVPDFWWSTAVLFIINPQMRIESLAHTSSIYAITSLLSPGYTCPAKCVSTVNTLNGHWSVLSKYWRQVSFNILTRSLGATGAQLLVDI